MDTIQLQNEIASLDPLEKWTALILLILIGVVILIDVFLYINDEPGDTISNILRNWAYNKGYFITFAWGVLTGHFFLGTNESIFGKDQIPVFIILGVLLLILYLHAVFMKPKIKPVHQLSLLCLGILFGHFFWTMNIPQQ